VVRLDSCDSSADSAKDDDCLPTDSGWNYWKGHSQYVSRFPKLGLPIKRNPRYKEASARYAREDGAEFSSTIVEFKKILDSQILLEDVVEYASSTSNTTPEATAAEGEFDSNRGGVSDDFGCPAHSK